MSLNFDNLVETSSSLAQVIIKDGSFETKSLQRSSVETTKDDVARTIRSVFDLLGADVEQTGRSEERRVGKECRSRWSPDHYKKKDAQPEHVVTQVWTGM